MVVLYVKSASLHPHGQRDAICKELLSFITISLSQCLLWSMTSVKMLSMLISLWENYQHSSLTRVLSPLYTLMVTLLSVPQVNADQHCVVITNSVSYFLKDALQFKNKNLDYVNI